MKGSLSAAEVHKQYSDGITAFRRQVSDATLRDICTRRPTTKEDLLQISGIGEMKAARYGPAFLTLVKRHAK